MDSIIRDASNADAAAVWEVLYSVLAEYGLVPDPDGTDADLADLEDSYWRSGGVFRVVVSPQGRIVGCAGLFRLNSEEAEIRKMYLLPAARGRGRGRLLLNQLVADARRLGYQRVVLETASVLTEAIALYRSAGFSPAPRDHLSSRCDQAWGLSLSPADPDHRVHRQRMSGDTGRTSPGSDGAPKACLEDSITISPYDPAWPIRFEAEAKRIRDALGSAAVRIDHVGSTAVPGLAAKPVIDIQVSVRILHPLEPHLSPLLAIGYTHVPHPDDATYPFLHRPSHWPHLQHIHLCEAGGIEERRHLAFRDYLRDHPEEAAAYAVEKQRLAVDFSASTFESRNAYAEAKSAFIESIVQRGLALGYPRA